MKQHSKLPEIHDKPIEYLEDDWYNLLDDTTTDMYDFFYMVGILCLTVPIMFGILLLMLL